MRVIASDKASREVDGLTGRQYTQKRDGSFDMHPRDAKAYVAWGGFIPSMTGVTRKALGYRCEGCGFGTFVKTCSRCGGNAVREG